MKTLIVDDREEDLYLLETLLKGNGYDVISASNGAEALDRLHSDTFDLVISDILMPVMDGFQLCRELRRDDNLRDIPLVFYTATYTDEKDERLALQLGADKFLRKPMEPNEIIGEIECLTSSARKAKTVRKTKPSSGEEEKEVLELYSKRLVEKLEKKTLELEREITERKNTEKALKVSEERLKETVERLKVSHKALSTPVVQIWDKALALPLIGTVDSYRAQQITEVLLNEIVSTQSEVVIIDITGVAAMDSNVVDYLIRAVESVSLLGARCVLTGIQPEVAQLVVSLSMDMSRVVVRRDMQAGLKWALQNLEYEDRDDRLLEM